MKIRNGYARTRGGREGGSYKIARTRILWTAPNPPPLNGLLTVSFRINGTPQNKLRPLIFCELIFLSKKKLLPLMSLFVSRLCGSLMLVVGKPVNRQSPPVAGRL